MRSVSSSLRESKKRVNKLDRRLKFAVAENQKIQAEKQRIEAEKQTIENRNSSNVDNIKCVNRKLKRSFLRQNDYLPTPSAGLKSFVLSRTGRNPNTSVSIGAIVECSNRLLNRYMKFCLVIVSIHDTENGEMSGDLASSSYYLKLWFRIHRSMY